MSLSNTSENNALLLIFNNTNWANVGDATGLRGSTVPGSFYISLHTSDPGETGTQTTNEIAYTNYLRIAVARASGAGGWTVSGTAPTQAVNASIASFAACGVTGATATHAIIGRDSSSTGEAIWYGALGSSLIINSGITPSFGAGALIATLD